MSRPARRRRNRADPERRRRGIAGRCYAEALTAPRGRHAEAGAVELHAYDRADVFAGQRPVRREFEHDPPELTHILIAISGPIGGSPPGMRALPPTAVSSRRPSHAARLLVSGSHATHTSAEATRDLHIRVTNPGESGMTKISLILFDLNGVLYRYDRDARIAHLASVSGRTQEAIRTAIWDSGFEDSGDAGTLVPRVIDSEENVRIDAF